jgi:hypothetical protein
VLVNDGSVIHFGFDKMQNIRMWKIDTTDEYPNGG